MGIVWQSLKCAVFTCYLQCFLRSWGRVGLLMKNKPFFRYAALFTSVMLPITSQALEVHEWGTFTILVSSKGQTVNWYQPYSDAAKLPKFVNMNPMLMKSNIPFARVRMETPVLYFYPEEEMDISVRVAFAEGSITERFPVTNDEPYTSSSSPFVVHQIEGLNSSIACSIRFPSSDEIFDKKMREFSVKAPPAAVRWTGKLLPPSHEDGKLIPAVASKQGNNYAAARNVPDAWIFHSAVPNKLMPDVHQVEKFIFYRGAGQSLPPYSVSMPDDRSMSFSSNSQSDSTFLVALRVKDGKASWVQMPNVPGPSKDAVRSTNITFHDEAVSLEQADTELRALFQTELAERGLSKAEAKAMVDTWNHTWFSEPGQRVFTIVDRTWVDSVLPLAISPQPTNIERVFVARYEVLSPTTEKELGDIMSKNTSSTAPVKKIADLELGRFIHGAAEIVAEKVKGDLISQFRSIQYKEQTPVNVEK
jgi:hypothetical protein